MAVRRSLRLRLNESSTSVNMGESSETDSGTPSNSHSVVAAASNSSHSLSSTTTELVAESPNRDDWDIEELRMGCCSSRLNGSPAELSPRGISLPQRNSSREIVVQPEESRQEAVPATLSSLNASSLAGNEVFSTESTRTVANPARPVDSLHGSPPSSSAAQFDNCHQTSQSSTRRRSLRSSLSIIPGLENNGAQPTTSAHLSGGSHSTDNNVVRLHPLNTSLPSNAIMDRINTSRGSLRTSSCDSLLHASETTLSTAIDNLRRIRLSLSQSSLSVAATSSQSIPVVSLHGSQLSATREQDGDAAVSVLESSSQGILESTSIDIQPESEQRRRRSCQLSPIGPRSNEQNVAAEDALLVEKMDTEEGDISWAHYEREKDFVLKSGFCVPRACFRKIVKQALNNYPRGYRICPEAVEALQTAAEDFLINLFRRSKHLTKARNAKVAIPVDLRRVLKIREENFVSQLGPVRKRSLPRRSKIIQRLNTPGIPLGKLPTPPELSANQSIS